MLSLSSPAEVVSKWAALRRNYPALPADLKDHQRDALFNILNGNNVILNVPTGNFVTNSMETLMPEHRGGQDSGRTLLHPPFPRP